MNERDHLVKLRDTMQSRTEEPGWCKDSDVGITYTLLLQDIRTALGFDPVYAQQQDDPTALLRRSLEVQTAARVAAEERSAEMAQQLDKYIEVNKDLNLQLQRAASVLSAVRDMID